MNDLSQIPTAELVKMYRGESSDLSNIPTAELVKAYKESVPESGLEDKKKSTILERIGTGLADPIHGGAQLLTHILPEGIVKAGNDLNNWLADKGLPLEKIKDGGVDQLVNERESEYQKQRAAAGSEGIDWARMAGNVASPANIPLAMTGGLPASLTGRVAQGAAMGGASSMLSPVTQNTENFGKEKLEQAGIGALTGSAVPIAAAGAGRMINPQVRESVKEMMANGITPTIGKILGGTAERVEDKLMSVPLLGEAISLARRDGIEQMNKAVYDMALQPIGEKSTKPIGRAGLSEVYNKLRAWYDKVLSGKNVTIDNKLNDDIAGIVGNAVLTKRAQVELGSVVKKVVSDNIPDSGVMSGKEWKLVESELGDFIRTYKRASEPMLQQVGHTLEDVQMALRNAVARSNPEMAKDILAVNKGYSIYARMRDAAAMKGSKQGVITPATLESAVNRQSSKNQVALGQAPMKHFTDSVVDVLEGKTPNSFTWDRAALNAILFGSAAVHPAGLAAAAIGTIPYMPGIRKGVAAAMTQRPDFAEPMAQAVRQGAQYAVPGMAENAARQNQQEMMQ